MDVFRVLTMTRLNTKGVIWATAIIIIGIYLIIDNWFHSSLFSDISKTVTICTIIVTVYSKWLWKVYPLTKLLKVPYLGGKWEGELNSTYPGAHPIKIHAIIQHGFLHSYLKLTTDESTSISNSFTFNINEQMGIRQIIYTYQNDPYATERAHSEIHYGTAVLNIDDKGTCLNGNYWTDRKTTGSITLQRIK